MKLLSECNIDNIENVISLAIFGSYNTSYWRANNSDIDILVLMNKREDVMDEFDLEDKLLPILKSYFEYDNIHITFMNMRSYDTIFARQYIDSTDKLIVDKFREIDFRLYISKYNRDNAWLINNIKRDTKLMESEKNVAIL